jgi:ATP-dependent exoDNAse (exonuclease V) beta subunit
MVRGYVPARAVQLFYGTIIHEVLDRAHHHFKGLQNPSTKGKLPTSNDIESYFTEVENALRARGIKAVNNDLTVKARELLKKFNEREGPSLYPRVLDTEHRLQGNRESYLVEGVIDVLVGQDGSNSPDKVEIWDYKGAKKPTKKNKADLESYEYQMQVYGALYRMRNGVYPRKAVLYFMNELEDGASGDPMHIVDLSEEKINRALEAFDVTAGEIANCKKANR